MVQEDSDEGKKKVWSTDSEDEEVRRTTHAECIVAKSEEKGNEGMCLMVQGNSLKEKGYCNDGKKASEGGKVSDSCFSAKLIKEQVAECEKVVDKVHSILKSLTNPISR